MKLIKRINQHRRDFTGLYECEHCGHKEEKPRGYDDTNFHMNVIPFMKCPKCEKMAPKDRIDSAPKYHDDEQI